MASGRSADILRDGGHIFYIRRNGSGSGCSLLSYEGPGGEVRVPDGVACISGEAFSWCSHVTDVILPEGVWIIGWKAFWHSGIRHISLPETLKWIEELAFSQTPLDCIDIPDGTEHVDNRAFLDAAQLRRAKLPEKLASLEPEVFSGCVSLKEVVLPAGLKYIQGRAFQNCAAMERIRLPEGVTAVWRRAFSGCRSLQEVDLGDRTETIGAGAFAGCTALKKIRIPENLKMTDGCAFEHDARVELTGPGAARGILIHEDPAVYYFPGEQKAVIPEGTETLAESYNLWTRTPVRVLELPESLKAFSWFYLAQIGDLCRVVTDKGDSGPEIAYLLDAECVNKKGRKRTFRPRVRHGRWMTERDKENKGVRITGRLGKTGETGREEYATLVIPGRIRGRKVTAIGAGVFADCDTVGAVYLPDSVRRIENGAFARCGYDMYGGRTLFLRMPRHVRFTPGAFAGTEYITRQSAREKQQRQSPKPPEKTAEGSFSGAKPDRFAAAAADDPAVGTGTAGRPDLQPNVWQYLDRMSREERIRALTHSFLVKGGIDGAGWASVRIELDGEKTRFRISYIGNSLADFRRFAGEIPDGGNESFGWSAEPGGYSWRIQRRGGILYVDAPEITNSFFISRREFLWVIRDMTDEWRR